jgi:hypothetical protein
MSGWDEDCEGRDPPTNSLTCQIIVCIAFATSVFRERRGQFSSTQIWNVMWVELSGLLPLSLGKHCQLVLQMETAFTLVSARPLISVSLRRRWRWRGCQVTGNTFQWTTNEIWKYVCCCHKIWHSCWRDVDACAVYRTNEALCPCLDEREHRLTMANDVTCVFVKQTALKPSILGIAFFHALVQVPGHFLSHFRYVHAWFV